MRSPSLHTAVLIAFLANMAGPLPMAQAQEFRLPVPGVMVHLSPPLDPPVLKGIKVHPDDPFRIDFILDKGDSQSNTDQLKSGSSQLIKYFLASLTIPEKDLWVNLSPYEKDRIIPDSFGLTEMGRDLLAEDYILKQITASLIYPEDEIGKKFWKRVYEKAALKYGTTNIPVNTFNKVWIVPDKAVVYENAKAGTAYVVQSSLKVMLEQDYLALSHSVQKSTDINTLGSQVIREIVIPELNNEVNNDKNFAQLRQVYNSLILAAWYKKKITDSILVQVYADKKKVAGVGYGNTLNVSAIYQRYLQAFKKGVYNYIKEEQDPLTQQVTPRKYFSGGMSLIISPHLSYTTDIPDDKAMISPRRLWDLAVNLLRPQQVSLPAPEQMDPLFLKQVEVLKVDMQKFNDFLPQLKTAVGQYQRQEEKNAALDLDPNLTFDPNKGFGMVLAQLADANLQMQQGNIPKAMQEWGRVFGIYQAVQAGFVPYLRQYTDKPTRNFMYRFTQELNNYFGQYLKYYGLKGLRGMEGGAGAGRLVIVHGSEQEVLDQLKSLQPNEIVVMDQDYESLATAATNAGGFIFGREGAGHIMTRARALKVPVMSLPNAVEYLKQFDGQEWVEMDNHDKGGELRFLKPEERNIAPALQRSPDVVPPVERELKGEAIVGSDDLYKSPPSIVLASLIDMARSMGYKAANLIYNRREAGVPMPRSVILMNRFFEDLLEDNNIKRQLKARFKMIDKSEPQTVRQNLEAMQELIRDMQVPGELKQEIWEKLEFIKVPYLILRLSTGAEDLEDFPGVGAGVYGSLERIPWAVKTGDTYEIPQANKDNLIIRMLETYATYWSFKAYADREHFSIDHWAVGNAMIIQEYLTEAKYSVLVHTAEPSTRNSNIMKIEIVPGAGKSITDTDPFLQGSALTLFYDKTARKIIGEDDPRTQYHPIDLNKKYMVSLETGANEPIDKNEYPELWTSEGRSALADQVAAIASKLENNHERAQDIEGVILGSEFIPVQSRAQENIAPYQGGYREQQEYQRWTKALNAWLVTYGRQNIEDLDFYKGESFEAPSLRDLLPIRNKRPSNFRTSILRSLGLYDKTGSVEHITRLYNFLTSTKEFSDVREGIMRRTLFYVAMEHSAFVEYFFGLADKPDLLLKMVHYAIMPLTKDSINRGEFNRDWFMQVNAFLLVRALARSQDLQEKLPFIIKNLSSQDLVSLINQIYLSSKSGELNKGEVKSLKKQFKDILESPDMRRSDHPQMLAGLLPEAAQDFAMKANVDPMIVRLFGLWEKKLQESRPYWRQDPRFGFPYNYRAPSIAYDPRSIFHRQIGPFEQIAFSALPERDDLEFTPEDVTEANAAKGLARELKNVLMIDAGNKDLVIVPARWPLTEYHMLGVSQDQVPQKETASFLQSEFRLAKRGLAVEFHRREFMLDHYHFQLFRSQDAPILKYAGTFRADLEHNGVRVGTLTGYPVPQFVLTSPDLEKLGSATMMVHQILESGKILFTRDIFEDDNGQLMVAFFIYTGDKVGFRFNTIGQVRSDDFHLSVQDIENGLVKMFIPKEDQDALRDEFWAQWTKADQAMTSGTYAHKPEREITERQALRDAAVEVQLSLNDLYAALSVTTSQEQALQIRAGIADLEERIGITIDTTLSYQDYSGRLKAKRQERDVLYADFEKAYLDKELQGAARARVFAELNLRAIHINQEIMELQIIIADLLLSGRSQLKQASMMQKAALWTLEGALNSTAMLKEELNYRISRLQAQTRVRRIETKDWLGNIVRTFRLGALDIKVLEGPASENLPNVTIRQQRWINIPAQLRDTLTDARQGRISDALNKLERLSPLFDVRYLSFYKRFGEIKSGIKALQGALSGLQEGVKPDQETIAGLKASIDHLTALVSARPKRRVWEDVNVRDIGAAFRSYIYRLSGYVQDIGKVSYNKVLIDSYIDRLNEAQTKGRLALRQQEMMRIGLEEILAWVDQGFVDQKQFSRADITAAIEGIGTSNWAGAAKALQRVQGQLQERLDDIDRIVMYSREHAAAVFSEYRDTDIKLRMDEISQLLDDRNIEDATNKLNEVQELYQLDDQLEPGLQRAGQGINYLIKVLTTSETIDTAKLQGYLAVIKDDVDHKTSFRIVVSNEAGETKYVYVPPNTSVEGLLNIGRRDITKIKVTVGRTVVPISGFVDYKLKDLSRVKIADKAMLAPGGIDLNPAHMNLQTQNAGSAIKFHLTPEMFQQFQNAPGFVPVIINIQPIASLKSWLKGTVPQMGTGH